MFEKGIDHWAQKELGLTRRKLELQNSLEAVEAEAGAALLDAEEAENGTGGASYAPSLDRLDRARAEIRALAAAITACRDRRIGAIKMKRATEVAGLLRQASEKAAELRSLESKTSKALEQLAALEGCEYAPAGTPKTSALKDEITRLERAARETDQQAVPDNGVVDLGDVIDNETILLAVAAYPATGPTVEQVLAWLLECEGAAVAATHSGFGDLPRRVRLAWNATSIDAGQSYVFVAALAAKRKGNFPDSDECLDVGSATFRANTPTIATGGRNAQSPDEAQGRSGFYRG